MIIVQNNVLDWFITTLLFFVITLFLPPALHVKYRFPAATYIVGGQEVSVRYNVQTQV